MYEELILDDDGLLADRLLRSLHRNTDGHLSSSIRDHYTSVLTTHNIAVLYIYTLADNAYMLHEHYVFSYDPLPYEQWQPVVYNECKLLYANPVKDFYGVYGWQTSHLRITPLRNGDLFIKIDKDGVVSVRLSFGSLSNKHDAHSKEKASKKRVSSNRVRQ
jgi:hypothetical protein